MYSQLTTGAKTRVVSKVKSDSSAVFVDLGIDTKKNKAMKSSEKRDIWIDERTGEEISHGLRITTVMKAKYQRGKKSVYPILENDLNCESACIDFSCCDGQGRGNYRGRKLGKD